MVLRSTYAKQMILAGNSHYPWHPPSRIIAAVQVQHQCRWSKKQSELVHWSCTQTEAIYQKIHRQGGVLHCRKGRGNISPKLSWLRAQYFRRSAHATDPLGSGVWEFSLPPSYCSGQLPLAHKSCDKLLQLECKVSAPSAALILHLNCSNYSSGWMSMVNWIPCQNHLLYLCAS